MQDTNTKQMEVRNFKLELDGIYTIVLEDGKRVMAGITLYTLNKMMEAEGMEIKDLSNILSLNFKTMEFKKAVLLCDVFDKGKGKYSFLASESPEKDDSKRLALVDFTIKE